MRRLVSKLTIGTVMMCGVFSVALPHVSAASKAGTAEVGTMCASEQHSWSGNTELGAGEAFFTGVNIAAQDGTELTVASVGASTNEGSVALAVQVGGTVAAQGSATNGGGISVGNTGSSTVHVTSVDVVVTRCQQVASAAVQSVRQVSVDANRIAAQVLPSTGAASTGLMVAAVLLIGAGISMVAISRRRRPI